MVATFLRERTRYILLDLSGTNYPKPVLAMTRRIISSKKQTGLVLSVFVLVAILVLPISSWFSRKLFPNGSESHHMQLYAVDDQVTPLYNHNQEITQAIGGYVSASADSEKKSTLFDGFIDIVTEYGIETSSALTSESAEIFSSISETSTRELKLYFPTHNRSAHELSSAPQPINSFLGETYFDNKPKLVETTSNGHQVSTTQPTIGAAEIDTEQELEIIITSMETNATFKISEDISLDVLAMPGAYFSSTEKMPANTFYSMDDYPGMSADKFTTLLSADMAYNYGEVMSTLPGEPSNIENHASFSISTSVLTHSDMERLRIGQPESLHTEQYISIDSPAEKIKPTVRPRARPVVSFVASKPIEKPPVLKDFRTETPMGEPLADALEIRVIGVKVIGLFKLPNTSWMLIEKRDGTIVKLLEGSQFNGMRVLEIGRNFALLQSGLRKFTVSLGMTL